MWFHVVPCGCATCVEFFSNFVLAIDVGLIVGQAYPPVTHTQFMSALLASYIMVCIVHSSGGMRQVTMQCDAFMLVTQYDYTFGIVD